MSQVSLGDISGATRPSFVPDGDISGKTREVSAGDSSGESESMTDGGRCEAGGSEAGSGG